MPNKKLTDGEMREKIDRIIDDCYNDELTATATDVIMQEFHAHMKAMLADVIGEDEKPVEVDGFYFSAQEVNKSVQVVNSTKAQQRQRAAKWLPKEVPSE